MDRGQLLLTLGLESDDQPIEAVLEEQGRRRVLVGDVDDLLPFGDTLVGLDLADFPNAALLVARVLQRSLRSPDQAHLLAAASHDTFAALGDVEGMGAAELVLGDLAWQRGQITEADRHWSAAMGHEAAGPSSAGLLTLRAAADFLTLGDVDRSMPRVHEAYAATMLDGTEIDEAMATLLGGLLLIDTGDLQRSSDALQRADDLFGEVEAERDVAMWPLVSLGLGEIAVRRGETEVARSWFEQGRGLAERLGRPNVAIAAQAMIPLHLSSEDPDTELARAVETVARAEDLDAHWFARQLADRALAEAYLANGLLGEAAEQAARCVERAGNPLLRAKCVMLEGRIALRQGDTAVAIRALDEAATTFLSRGTYLWGVDALLVLAAADPGRATEYLGLAFDRTGADRAFQRLWDRRPPFTVTLGPDGHSRFVLDGQELRLGDKGELLVAEVVRSGEAGLHWEQAAAALWPEDTNHDRIKSR
ncbi:MAG TPA: hypothetical protein VIJ47_02460, partial [Acidimicrobiales bacterium]